MPDTMTSKQRVHAAMEGRPVDRMPVTSLYRFLYHADHFTELTGRPAWQRIQWEYESPEEHLATLRGILDAAPLEIVNMPHSHPRERREGTTFFEKDGQAFINYNGESQPIITETRSGHAWDQGPEQTQRIFSEEDIDAIHVTPAEERVVAEGQDDYANACMAGDIGRDQFILTGGVVGTVYSCSSHLGMTNAFATFAETPAFMDRLCAKICEANIQGLRHMAREGGDAMQIDDATATSDMISLEHYERFSLPYMKEMVREIHNLGFKAIIIYFGGVMDRLEQIASIGADALQVEAKMKTYTNDIAQIAERIGDRVTLFGNLNPLTDLQQAGDDELEAEIVRQVEAGHRARGFLISTGSPITPGTPLSRIRKYIELGRKHGVSR